MRRSSPSGAGFGADELIPLETRDPSSALISSAGGGRAQLTTHFDFFLVNGDMSGETVISGEGCLLDTGSVSAMGASVEGFGNGRGRGSIFGSSQLRLIAVNCLASSGESSGASDGIVITRAERSDFVMN